MDSATHVVMGFGLAGLSALDPALVHHSITSDAVIFGTVIGSVIPDIDTVLKFKDNATYIRHHRGLTHSLPATCIWPIIITLGLMVFFPGVNVLHLWLWTFLAVFLHVFVDIFNAYGTQAARPITNKWIALDMISIFDPFIFLVHIAGFVVWIFLGHSGVTFLAIYFLLVLYYLLRAYQHHRAITIVKAALPEAQNVFLSPTMRPTQYHVAVKSREHFYVGELKGVDVNVLDTFDRTPIPDHPAIRAAKSDKNISAFLSFSPIYRWEIVDTPKHCDIRFIDLRYLTKGHYPFVAIARLDQQMHVVSSYTGWVYNKEKLEKKLATTDG
ncbi:metal-dependent hydrolase [Camelliibacillus cellulosilyticus]|uniref:Metal-dependent hydrolase n=1 Tax=Camelliibacillus cellulosilyticus TaxID=2174486 RepID=A0ABV9GQV5_9BACL